MGRSAGRSVRGPIDQRVGRSADHAGRSVNGPVGLRVGPVGLSTVRLTGRSTGRSVNGSVGRRVGPVGQAGSVGEGIGWSTGRPVGSATGGPARRTENLRTEVTQQCNTIQHGGHRRGIGRPFRWASGGHPGASWGIGGRQAPNRSPYVQKGNAAAAQQNVPGTLQWPPANVRTMATEKH